MEQSGPRRERSSRAARDADLVPLGWISTLLERAVTSSPADETEIVWIEVRRSRAAVGLRTAEPSVRTERNALVRVREGGRRGSFRIGTPDAGVLELAVRHAMAAARGAQRRPTPPLPGPEEAVPERRNTFDRRLATLEPSGAEQLLRSLARTGETATLDWSEGRVLVRNSRGLVRRSKATSATVNVRSGEGAAAGLCCQSARSLEQLGAAAVFERARTRRAPRGRTVPLAGTRPVAMVLSPEAVIELIDQLNHHAFAAHAYREGSSFLRSHIGVQVFDRRFHLRDDAADVRGLPFPFDLEGRSKRPLDLVEHGVPKTPTLDTWSAYDLGLEPTGHCVGGEEAYALNLLMEPGDLSQSALLERIGQGLWVSRLDGVEVFDPARMRFRARCRGVRTIAGGILTDGAPELSWEDSLLRLFSALPALGSELAARVSHDGLLGGTAAPAVGLEDVEGLEPLV